MSELKVSTEMSSIQESPSAVILILDSEIKTQEEQIKTFRAHVSKLKELKKEYIKEIKTLNKLHGKRKKSTGNKSNNGNPILSWSKHGGSNQQWTLNRLSNGKYHIKESSHNKCLDDTGKKGVNQFYHLWSCGTTNSNQWFEFKTVSTSTSETPNL